MYIEILNSVQVLITEQQTSYMHGVFLCRWFSHVLQFTIVSGDRSMLVTRYEHRGFFFPGFTVTLLNLFHVYSGRQIDSTILNIIYYGKPYAWSIIIWSNRVRIIYNRSDKYECYSPRISMSLLTAWVSYKQMFIRSIICINSFVQQCGFLFSIN